MRGRRPREADADSDEEVGEPDLPVGAALLPEEEHREEGEEESDVAAEQREAGSSRLHELRGARRDEDHEDDRRQDRGAGFDRGVAEHVLQVLLADERRRHQRAEDDDPGAGGHPEDSAGGNVEVVERVRCAALAEVERDPGRERDGEQADRESALVRDRREVDPEDERPHHDQREDAAEVVDRVRRLVHVAGHEDDCHHEGDADERKRDEEDGAPPELLQEQAGDERTRAAMPPPIADHSAIARVRPAPAQAP